MNDSVWLILFAIMFCVVVFALMQRHKKREMKNANPIIIQSRGPAWVERPYLYPKYYGGNKLPRRKWWKFWH